MIKTVIFDIGNVLVRFAWKPYITELFDEETADHITEALWHDGYWNEFDRGILTDEQIREKMVVFIKLLKVFDESQSGSIGFFTLHGWRCVFL